jgi:AmmeMemoRadiSam system protein A
MTVALPQLSSDDRAFLLRLARESVCASAARDPLPNPNLESLSAKFRTPGACFVTLHKGGQLRGCTGVLVARAPLALEVIHSAAQTALYDPRFDAVVPHEVPEIAIEISVLTPPAILAYKDSEELVKLVRPGIDGVTLSIGGNRATFLPQVWERVPEPREFLSMLCEKMGLPRRTWQVRLLDVEIYQVEEFAEPGFFTAARTHSSEAGM